MTALAAWTLPTLRPRHGAQRAEIHQPGREPFFWSSPVNAKVMSTIEINAAWFGWGDHRWPTCLWVRARPAG
jgi:hypothetical protein